MKNAKTIKEIIIPGDIFIVDGIEYIVEKYGDRNVLNPIPGVTLLGNAVIGIDPNGKKYLFYEWDGEKK